MTTLQKHSSKIYPRTLIVYHNCINNVDQHGVSIRSWFADWPKENLTQIYSGGEVGTMKFCKFNFKIGPTERRFGRLFNKIKSSSIGQSSYTITLEDKNTKLKYYNSFSLIKNKVSNWLINTGIWEIIFKIKISKEMANYIEEFNPEIIYCQGYNLTFALLPILLQKKYNIPICFQTGDDWPSHLYKNTLLSFAIRPIVKNTTYTLLSKSSVRLANGNEMAMAYINKYGLHFETMMMCDNINRFRNAVPLRVVDDKIISIIYSGGLGHSRWNSILDLCKAIEILNEQNIYIVVTIMATEIPRDAINKIKNIHNLQILPASSHDDLPSYLKGADILFLPESFDPKEVDVIHLSISTKAHLYMMSEKPILLYAASQTGIAQYAKDEKWGCLVEKRDINKLAEAIQKILSNADYREQLISRGKSVALRNHDETIVRERFREVMNNAQLKTRLLK